MTTLVMILTLVFVAEGGQVHDLDQWIEPTRADMLDCYAQTDRNHTCSVTFAQFKED